MKELVIFDVDNTVVKGQSQALLISFLRQTGYIPYHTYIALIFWVLLYKLGVAKNPKPAMEYGLSFIKNKKTSEVESIIAEFFDKILVNYIYKEATEIIKEHQNLNRELILVSNAPDVLIEKLAKYLNINKYFSTQLEIINGIYTGKIIGDIMYGEQKLKTVNSFIESNHFSMKNSWAYGDHDSDEFLLSEVAHPYVVNPTSGLKKVAIKNNWPILIFKS